MTQIFQDDGRVIPVTAILAEPNVITQIKSEEKDTYSAVQVGFGGNKNIKKPQVGHLKGIEQSKVMREFRVNTEEVTDLNRGDKITVKVFENGDIVKVTGVSKGKGFQGVVKRHGFHGSPASHGHKDQLRMPGSIGATDAARVFKGMKMGGQMGDNQVTIAGLSVVDIDLDKNILYIKGAVPGARNGLVLISAPGKMDLTIAELEVNKEKAEEKKEEVSTEKKEEVKEEAPKSEVKEEEKK